MSEELTAEMALELAARDIADDLWSEEPLTDAEETAWNSALRQPVNMERLRRMRFMDVRGAPGRPAAQPDLWRAMLQHDGWSAWLAKLPTDPFSGALECDKDQPCPDGQVWCGCGDCFVPEVHGATGTNCATCAMFKADPKREIPRCCVLVGHRNPGDDIATWRSGSMLVCDRHRAQYDYDANPDLRPLEWEPIGDDS